MKAVLALLLGVTFAAKVDQNAYSKLVEKDAWQQEITYDWDELNHVKAFEGWKKEFGKKYKDNEEEAKHFITFLDNWKLINDFNIADVISFNLRMNQFSFLIGDVFLVYVHGQDG
eukprot:162456_1